MASRLQFQTPNATTVSAPPTAYQIEPELLGVCPRVLVADPLKRKSFDRTTPFFFVIMVGQLVPACSSFANGKMLPFLFALICLSVVLGIGGLIGTICTEARRTTNLLKRGIARQATILAVEKIGECFKLTLAVQTASSQKGAVLSNLPADTVTKNSLVVGTSFTVLVSPENENDLIPYFQCTGYRVVPIEATQVSHDVSARLAAQMTTVAVSQIGSRGAIEPELIGAGKRPVRLTKQQRGKYFWLFAGLPPLAFATHLVLQFGRTFPPWQMEQTMLLILVMGSAFRIGKFFAFPAESFSLLESGFATRAVIVDERIASQSVVPLKKRMASFTYEYELFTGKKVTANLSLPVKRAWQLGLAKGATFTVLYHLDSTHHQPYFQITDAEIIGAMGAKVSPP